MVQLRDVAIRAGVSTASVSRVLNHPEKVSRPVRERVTAAMLELGYVRDGTARALALRRSSTIGHVVPTLGIAIFASGVETLQQRLQESGYQLLLASTQYDSARELDAVRSLIERGVDGLALVGHRHDPEVYRMIARRGIPYVNTYQFDPDNEHPCIGFDNFGSAMAVTKFMLSMGHRDFGIITSPTRPNDRIAARLAGLLAALASEGIVLPRQRIVEVPYGISDGRSATHGLMRHDPQITAICCTTDVLAIGAVFELREKGFRVPADVSVTGFDDLEIVRHLDPPLTTVHAPAEQIGPRIADYLLASIEGRTMPRKTQLNANLVLRGSTAPPRSGRRRPDTAEL